MRLATIRTEGGTAAVRLTPGAMWAGAVETGDDDVRALLRRADWTDHAKLAVGTALRVEDVTYAPLIPTPGKIICVDRNHRAREGSAARTFPGAPRLRTYSAPVPVGAEDDILLPPASAMVSSGAQLAIVIGRGVRHASSPEARTAIAGYTIFTDIGERDRSDRPAESARGEAFGGQGPLGPLLVTPDEFGTDDVGPGGVEISTTLNGERVQHANTDQMVLGPVDLVAYVSSVLDLDPGDVIATGTPGDRAPARTPQRPLVDGDYLLSEIGGLGRCANRCRVQKG